MLDTTFCIASLNGFTEHLQDRLNREAFNLCVSAITVFELKTAVSQAKNPESSKRLMSVFLSNLEVLDFGERAATYSTAIRRSLDQKGLNLGSCDTLIAGHAKSESLTIVTADDNLFQPINGIKFENWLKYNR